LTDCAASAETCPRQSVYGLGRQSFHANPYRSRFARTNQVPNFLVLLPDDILANDRIVSEQGTAGRCKCCQKTNDLRVCFLESAPRAGHNRQGDKADHISGLPAPQGVASRSSWTWRRNPRSATAANGARVPGSARLSSRRKKQNAIISANRRWR